MAIWIALLISCFCFWMAIKTALMQTKETVKAVETRGNSARESFTKVYRLAPDTSFATLCNMVSIRVLHATTYTVNSTLLAEFDAAQKVRQEREREHIGISELTGKNPQEMQSVITEHIKDFLRPDIVLKKMTMYAKSYLHCSKQVAEDICFPIVKEVYSFNLKYAEMMGYEDALCEKAWEKATEAYQKRNADGLGFGIITTSAASMMAYSALDSYERNKQLKNQETSIYVQHGIHAKAAGATFCDAVLGYYKTTYMPNAIAAIGVITEVMEKWKNKQSDEKGSIATDNGKV